METKVAIVYVLLALSTLVHGSSIPKYRQLGETGHSLPVLPVTEELEDEYAERRIMAEQFYDDGDAVVCAGGPKPGPRFRVPPAKAPARVQTKPPQPKRASKPQPKPATAPLKSPPAQPKSPPAQPKPTTAPVNPAQVPARTPRARAKPIPEPAKSAATPAKPPSASRIESAPMPPPPTLKTPVLLPYNPSKGDVDEPSICGNSSTSLTVSIAGTAANTSCTAILSLSSYGADTCADVGQLFGGECDVFKGGLYINIGFDNPSGTHEPNVQAGLDLLGLGNLSQIGLLHVNLGGNGSQILSSVNFLPNLQAIIGAENPIPSNGFAGAALYVSAASGLDVATLPSLKRLTDINGTTIIQDLALTNLTTGLSNLQIVEGDFVVEDNPTITSLAGTSQALTTVLGQVYIANNQQLLSLAGDNATTARPGALKTIGGQLIIGNNPAMTALAGLEQLEHVGGPITISQNQMLSNITALSKYAGCPHNSSDLTTPVPIFIQVMIQLQPGAPPITCIMNTFPAICAYIKNGYCPTPDGSKSATESSGLLGG